MTPDATPTEAEEVAVAEDPTEEAEEVVDEPTIEPTAEPTEILVDESKVFAIVSPYAALSEDVIKDLGADSFAGTDQEIANAIIVWQGENMFYIGDPNVQADISFPMRWNYFMPGIFPVEEMVKERRLDNGKIYGLCWDYASIFSALIAH